MGQEQVWMVHGLRRGGGRDKAVTRHGGKARPAAAGTESSRAEATTPVRGPQCPPQWETSHSTPLRVQTKSSRPPNPPADAAAARRP